MAPASEQASSLLPYDLYHAFTGSHQAWRCLPVKWGRKVSRQTKSSAFVPSSLISNRRIIVANATYISQYAKLMPKQLLGPLLNVTSHWSRPAAFGPNPSVYVEDFGMFEYLARLVYEHGRHPNQRPSWDALASYHCSWRRYHPEQ
jgi:hypothetical protein